MRNRIRTVSISMSQCFFQTGVLRRTPTLAILLLLVFGRAAAGAPAGWNYTWGDEFEGNAVDQTKWDRIFWLTPFNNERQAYHPSRATVSDGYLKLTADSADLGGKEYTSGKVESRYAQQHGRWEIRAKLPGTQGTWPAIWLLPATETYGWPSQGEIDILENRGHQPHLTSSAFHWGPDFFGRQFTFDEYEAANGGVDEDFHNEFHTYSVEWDASKIRFFVDDVHYHTITNAETANSFYPGGFLAQQTAPMELNLNVAVGGDFVNGAQPDDSISEWPQEMLIDYVRVYQRDATPPPVVFQNGSFETGGGSLGSWSTFGNAVSNVSTHNEAPAIDGSETLKLFGQFNGGLNWSGVEQGISVTAGDTISATASALIRAVDDLVGSNQVTMKFDYYSDFGGKFASPEYLGESSVKLIGDAGTANDVWEEHSLTDTVPAGAVEARLVFVFRQDGSDGGAIHIDDVSFANLDLEFNADANADGAINGTDFLAWQRGYGRDDGTSVADGDFDYDGVVSDADLAVWQSSVNVATASAAATVPEPSGLLLILFAPLLRESSARSHERCRVD